MLVTICIPICFELPFLEGSLRQIQKYKHPDIDHEILIMNQTEQKWHKKINDLAQEYGAKVIDIPRIDAGYPIDVASRIANGEYFCTLDADAFPISFDWLNLPIQLIKKFGFSFIGKESGLHHAYKNSLGNYFHLNNYYRVSKTSTAKFLSEKIGFIRQQNKSRSELRYEINDVNVSCDNGVLAQWLSDKENLGPKLSLKMDKIIGKTPNMGVYGMVIDDLVFHMVFGQTNEEYGYLNQEYQELSNRIYSEGLTEEIINLLLSKAKIENIINLYGFENLSINGRQYYDNDNHRFLSDDDEITKFIESIL
jgi:hypothetical protein